MSDREKAREAARLALFPRPHNPTHVDAIDVARWDAFDAGWDARGVEGTTPAHIEIVKHAERRECEAWGHRNVEGVCERCGDRIYETPSP